MRTELKSLLKADNHGATLPQPELMSADLKMAAHQLIGLSWIHGLRKHGASGILADEMGLGKTVQTIAVLAQMLQHGDAGPHLIVAPTSTLENWMREMRMWCPALSAVKYDGLEAERAELREELLHGELRGAHVVLCSFARFQGSSDKAVAEQRFLQKTLGKKSARGGLSYLVVDEAQQIKNASSARHKALAQIVADHRLLLTGTPVENSAAELLALLSFLMPRLFSTDGSLNRVFASLDSQDEDAVRRARQIKKLMGPFVLRRLKTEVLGALPPKTEEISLVSMLPEQHKVYQATLQRIARQAQERAKGEQLTESNWILSSFTELRKACNHPLLLQAHYTPLLRDIASVLESEAHFGVDASFERIIEEISGYSDLDLLLTCHEYPSLRRHALGPEHLFESAKTRALQTLLPQLQAEGHRTLIFSQWTKILDVLGLALEHMQIAFRRFDGSTPAAERQRLIDEFTADETIGVFLLSTRAGGLGINMTAADTVILHDVDFNPAMDQQAMDRVHRMGQARPVRVIKLATAASVDEKVVQVAPPRRATPVVPTAPSTARRALP